MLAERSSARSREAALLLLLCLSALASAKRCYDFDTDKEKCGSSKDVGGAQCYFCIVRVPESKPADGASTSCNSKEYLDSFKYEREYWQCEDYSAPANDLTDAEDSFRVAAAAGFTCMGKGTKPECMDAVDKRGEPCFWCSSLEAETFMCMSERFRGVLKYASGREPKCSPKAGTMSTTVAFHSGFHDDSGFSLTRSNFGNGVSPGESYHKYLMQTGRKSNDFHLSPGSDFSGGSDITLGPRMKHKEMLTHVDGSPLHVEKLQRVGNESDQVSPKPASTMPRAQSGNSAAAALNPPATTIETKTVVKQTPYGPETHTITTTVTRKLIDDGATVERGGGAQGSGSKAVGGKAVGGKAVGGKAVGVDGNSVGPAFGGRSGMRGSEVQRTSVDVGTVSGAGDDEDVKGNAMEPRNPLEESDAVPEEQGVHHLTFTDGDAVKHVGLEPSESGDCKGGATITKEPFGLGQPVQCKFKNYSGNKVGDKSAQQLQEKMFAFLDYIEDVMLGAVSTGKEDLPSDFFNAASKMLLGVGTALKACETNTPVVRERYNDWSAFLSENRKQTFRTEDVKFEIANQAKACEGSEQSYGGNANMLNSLQAPLLLRATSYGANVAQLDEAVRPAPSNIGKHLAVEPLFGGGGGNDDWDMPAGGLNGLHDESLSDENFQLDEHPYQPRWHTK